MSKKSFRKSLCLIDGSSYFYRAFFAIRPLSTRTGLPVNAIYGFATMLIKVLKDLKPDYVSVVFDAKDKTFRNEIYPDYKANRAEMPDDLVKQIPYIKSLVDAFHIFSLEKPGYEADDLIGTVCRRFKDQDIDIVIVSADKDLMQLIDDRVMMLDTMRDREIRAPEVKEKFGVSPQKVVDALALTGDHTDNIPGVCGIGPKTAASLLQQFGSLEEIFKHTDQLKGKLRESLEKEKEMAYLSRKLVTLDCGVPIEFKLEDFKPGGWRKEALLALFSELEFKRLIEQLGVPSFVIPSQTTLNISSGIDSRNYQMIFRQKDFETLLGKLKKASWLVVDLETTSLNTKKAEIVGIALCYPSSEKKNESCYIPLLHRSDPDKQLPAKGVLKTLRPILESGGIEKWGQNIKYDALIFAYHGIKLFPMTHDSMIASYILDPSERHNMDAMALKYLGHKTIHYSDITQKGKKQIGFDEVPLDIATAYAGEDADVTCRLVNILREKLKHEKRLEVYENIEMPLVPILTKMEFDGVKVDIPFLKQMLDDLSQMITIREKEIYMLAGEEFNIHSPKQLQKILFEKLRLPAKRKIKTGHSTDEEVLVALAEHHELPKALLSYREVSKLKSTYVDALIGLADPKTRRVHTSYNQTIAETGRLSSSNPNLQNIPIRSELGQKIRDAFISEKGSVLLSADYSQVELRLLAHFSGDPVLLKAFQEDQDIHAITAAEIFGISPEGVMPEMRRMAKSINFGLMYGLSAFGLSRQLKISTGKAREYMERYFLRYIKVKTYMEKVIGTAKEKGYVETMSGRRRYLPGLGSASPLLRQLSERMAINTPIQGTAADLIKIAMIQISKAFEKYGLKTKMILQVHDELVFEVPKSELSHVKAIVQKEMEGAMALSIPIKVSLHAGKTWGEAHA